MKHVHRSVAFVSGFALYTVVVVFGGGILAAVTVSRSYFAWFGVHKVLALVLLEAVVFALPVFLMAVAWSYLTVRMLPGDRRRATLWCLAGLVVAWIAWTSSAVVGLRTDPVIADLHWETLFVSLLVPPVWGVLNLLAAPCGVVLGGSIARGRGASLGSSMPSMR